MISNFGYLPAAALALATASTASAAEAPVKKIADLPPPVIMTVTPPAAAAKAPNFDAIMTLFDKLFPAQPDPDPARLALARASVQSMWPEGAYGKLMNGMMGSMLDHVMQMKAADFATLAAVPSKAGVSPADNRTLHDKAAAKDPHFDERMAAMREIMGEEIAKISAIIDPRMRDGLARAMARRFDAQQLADINAFFTTPSGHALASQYMQLWVDPDMMRAIMGGIPQMMRMMPDVALKMKAVEEKYPKPVATPAKSGKS